MSKKQIEELFVAGFGSSMLFGTFVGSFADKYGRRFNCMLYGILYGICCITKHFNDYNILMFGRLMGGIATSILYSAFESWMVAEHNSRLFDRGLISNTFTFATFGNSLVAIVAGLVANAIASHFGFVAPFDLSLMLLVTMCVLIMRTWPENYGDTSGHSLQSLQTAVRQLQTDPKIVCLGLVQSLFEGSMYMFVLMWTPVLQRGAGADDMIPHGYIFASFMVRSLSLSRFLDFPSGLCHFRSLSLSLARVLVLVAPMWFTLQPPGCRHAGQRHFPSADCNKCSRQVHAGRLRRVRVLPRRAHPLRQVAPRQSRGIRDI
jgi:MFS transporter, MFS domain-containing protein family, molybdate-anion transporter